MNSKEFSSFGTKLTTVSLSIFKSLIMRLVIFTLFSRMALRKISYSATSFSYAVTQIRIRIDQCELVNIHKKKVSYLSLRQTPYFASR